MGDEGYRPEFLDLYDDLRAPLDSRRLFGNRTRAGRLIRRRRPWKHLSTGETVREQRPLPVIELRTASEADAETVTAMLVERSGNQPVAVLSRCETGEGSAEPDAAPAAYAAVRRTEDDVAKLVNGLREHRGRKVDDPHRRSPGPLEFPRTESLLTLFEVFREDGRWGWQRKQDREGEQEDTGPPANYLNPLDITEALWERTERRRDDRRHTPVGADRSSPESPRSVLRWFGEPGGKGLDGVVRLARGGYTGLYNLINGLLRRLGANGAGNGISFDRFDQWVVTPLGLCINFLLGLSLLLGVQNIPDLEALEQVFTVLILLFLVLLRALVHLCLSRPWRPYRWLTRQPYLRYEGDSHFLVGHRAVAQHIGLTYRRLRSAHSGSGFGADRIDTLRDDARALRLLLVNAVLEDLTAAYPERHRYRTRFHRPVLIADRYATRWKGGRDTSAREADLVHLIERVRAEQYAPDPLVVVAVVPDPTPLADRDTGSAREAVTTWVERRRRCTHLGPERTVSVDIGPEAGDRERHHRNVRGVVQGEPTPGKRWREALTTTVAGLLVLLLLAGTATLMDLFNGRCWRPLLTDPGVWEVRGENGRRDCVGYTDGSFVFHERLAAVQGRIKEQNDGVVTARTPYVTVVYLGQLSVSDTEASNSRLAGVLGELTGLALRQKRHNADAPDKGSPRIRLLIANTGPGWRHGTAVAERIGRRAREENIVAAVGFGQSLTTTTETIEVLSRYALPMVSSTATFDDIAALHGSYSDFFFPIAPSNTRLGSQAAEWALRGASSTDADGTWELPATGTAVAVADTTSTESYGEDLANKFMDHFLAGGGRAGTEALGALAYRANGVIPYERNGGQSLDTVVERICADPPDLVYYAGRSANFGVLLDRLYDENRCADGITVLGGDDVAQYVTDNADRLSGVHDRISVYYTPLAADGVWGSPGAQNDEVPAFYENLADLTEELDADTPSIAHAVMAHDTLDVVSRALDSTDLPWGDPGRAGEAAAVVFPAIQQTGRQVGISGALDFGEVGTGYWYEDKLVQLVQVDAEGRPHVVAACGSITYQRRGGGPNCLETPETE
ncbi:hypothetical protein NI17_021630 [Thermobifida halotolerans]|uniref:Uncharacterized protein n=1 Tax=Thermobifida halotolerans TaxID=483545 RepID=A0AA97LWK3_9ACTN|nr:ABC transporter substrate-binding protein [Thermobifida halotolerans]UOE19303.1 hypothetical protein NI17_021630 [Thermobifida halotolerans]